MAAKDIVKKIITTDTPWLVFDLNGTLGSKTSARHARQKKTQLPGFLPRPGLLHLRRLCKMYRLAAWSSATERNTKRAVGIVQSLAGIQFEKVLDRGHCEPAPKSSRQHKWSTLKPLAPHFGSLSAVTMVEDTMAKCLEQERRNLILVPSWEEKNKTDPTLEILVDCLMAFGRHLTDLRPVTSIISDEVYLAVDTYYSRRLDQTKGGNIDLSHTHLSLCSMLEVCTLSHDPATEEAFVRQPTHLPRSP